MGGQREVVPLCSGYYTLCLGSYRSPDEIANILRENRANFIASPLCALCFSLRTLPLRINLFMDKQSSMGAWRSFRQQHIGSVIVCPRNVFTKNLIQTHGQVPHCLELLLLYL